MNQQQTQREVEFFDRFATEHGDYDVLAEGAYTRLTDLFERRVKPRRGEKCLDLGCGTGAFTRRLERFGLERTGMDISAASVERAGAMCPGARFVQGDIMATGLADASHDIIIYSGVLHHFDTSDLRRRVLAEGYRILRPGGRLFAYDPNAHSPSMWLYRDPRSPLFSSKGKTENEVLLSRAQLRDEIGSAGFPRVEVFGASGITFRHVESKAARLILPAYNLYERVVQLSPIENQIGTFLISVATK